MKKICAILLALALIVLGISLMPTQANAAKLGNLTYTIEDEEVTITLCNTKQSGDLVIPDQIEGYPVTNIAENAFKGCDKITSVTIPATLKAVDASAFDGCTGLTGVYISDLAAWCEIDFYNIMSSPLNNAKKLYLNGELVTDVVVPEGVTEVKDYTFVYCDDIKSVVIPDGVTTLENAFMYCTGLTEVTIADSVQVIDSTFSGCTALTAVRLPDSLTRLDAAFMNCTSLRSVTNLKNITFIASYTFYKCGLLEEVIIPDTVTTISYYAFYGCSSLTEIVIPDKVTSIGHNAFNGCTSLKTLTIGEKVDTLFEKTFYDCTALETIYYNATAMKASNIKSTFNNAGKYANGLVVYIGANVTRLPSGLFMPFTGVYHEAPCITEVVFEEGSVCELLEGSVFNQCKTLQKINLPDSIKNLGSMTFQSCEALTEIHLPASITKLESSVFQNCKALTAITIPEGVTAIASNAFYNCSALKEVTIPASVTSIGSKAFYNCTAIDDIYISDASAWCKISMADTDADPTYQLANLHIMNEQGEEVFYAILDETVTTLRSRAFNGARNLRSITIPSSVTTMAFGAFWNCTNLKHILYTGTQEQWNAISATGDVGITSKMVRHYDCVGDEVSEDCICSICGANLFYNYGDADGNGTVESEDARIVAWYLANYNYATGTSAVEITQDADANGDGKVDGLDVIRIKRYLNSYDYWTGEYTVGLGPQKHLGGGETVTKPTDARLAVESTEVTKGEEFTVTVRIENNPGFAYLELTPVFAPQLKLVKVENGEMIWDYYTNEQYIWSNYSGDVTADDVLMTLTFQADETAEVGSYQIDFQVRMFANYAEELLEMTTVKADVQVNEPAAVGMPGDLDSSEGVDEDDVIYLLQYLLMPEDFPVSQPVDYDHNNVIDEDDVIYLLQHLLMPEDFPL